MTPADAQISALRTDLHGVDKRLAVLETKHEERHIAVMGEFAALRRDLSDAGRTPEPTERSYAGAPPSLPPGAALSTLVPEADRTHRRDREESSEPGEIRISPKRVWPWIRLVLPWLLTALGGGGAVKALDLVSHAMGDSPTEEAP